MVSKPQLALTVMRLVLNEELNKLFDSHGTRMPEGEWGAKNSIQGYNTGSEERQWMSR